MKKRVFLAACAASLFLTSCLTVPDPAERGSATATLARTAHMRHENVTATPYFTLSAYTRPGNGLDPAYVYIEGDGLAWIGRGQPSADPTPTNPVALRLATAHAAAQPDAHIIYLARPCQYVKTPYCQRAYWTGKRFAPEMVAAMDAAVTQLTAGADGVELIGFSGGGTMAALLAARRTDVRTLRTVAGNLDHRTHSAIHRVSTLGGSLNPPAYAGKLRAIPQRHFTGANDRNVTQAVYDSYAEALGDTRCIAHTIVPGAEHEKGWDTQWPQLLAEPVACR